MALITLTSPKLSVRPAGSPVRLRLDHVDGLRALAALYVVLHHIWLDGRPRVRAHDWGAWLSHGHFAVTLFIVLSGYCLMLPVIRGDGTLRGGIIPYLKRRARRILPPYYAALGLTLLLTTVLIGHKTGAFWDYALPVSRNAIITHVLLLHDMTPAYYHKINYVFWSIAVEWHLYFVFPLLVVCWRRFGGVTTTCSAVAVGYLGNYLGRGTFVTGMVPHFLGMFTLGMFAASVAHGRGLVWERLRRRIPWRRVAWGSALCCVAICLIVGTAFPAFYERVESKVALLVAIGTVGVLVRCAEDDDGWLRRILCAKPLVTLGVFSYSLYLVHAPLQQVLLQYVFWPLGLRGESGFYPMLLLGLPMMIVASYGFHRIAERPFLSLSAPRPGGESRLRSEPAA